MQVHDKCIGKAMIHRGPARNWPERRSMMYGRLFAATHRTGRSVASMNLLIGAAALLDDAALVTRNVKDFSRIPGLRVLSY